MRGLTRASIRDRSARHCCHERKKAEESWPVCPRVGKASNKDGQSVGLECTFWEFWGADWSGVP
jgi:hypothetical protein